MGNNKEIEEITAGYGVTKVYVVTPWTTTHYEVGEPVAIYRKFEILEMGDVNVQNIIID